MKDKNQIKGEDDYAELARSVNFSLDLAESLTPACRKELYNELEGVVDDYIKTCIQGEKEKEEEKLVGTIRAIYNAAMNQANAKGREILLNPAKKRAMALSEQAREKIKDLDGIFEE